MADNNSRSVRRDAFGRGAVAAQRDSFGDDPFAELARLIGQSDPQSTSDRRPSQPAKTLDDAAPSALDWSALGEDRSQQSDEVQQSQPAAYQPHTAADSSWRQETGGDREPAARPYSPPAALFEDAIAAARQESDGYGGELGSVVPRPPALPFMPPAHDGDATYEDGQYQADASSHEDAGAADGYRGDVAAGRRRGALVIVAVLGVVVAGTAGALGYHAMFGGSMIPLLPPIIKPGDTPVKIVPKKTPSAGALSQAVDGKAGGDQLVPHEEKPVNIQSADAMPRVVTTIPVISNPAGEAPLPGATPPVGVQQAFNAPGTPAAPSASPGSGGAPASMSAPSGSGPFAQISDAGSAPSVGSKPVHTVIVKPTQSSPASRPAPVAPASARADRIRPPTKRTPREPQSRLASAAPLSIVPTRVGGISPLPAHTHTAAHASESASLGPTALGSRQAGAAKPMGRGYAVQVSAQRSEAAAQAEFHALQAKFPQQLGRREGWVRRANLGAKGVYYRVLVGPLASAEEASSLCGSLKAAGASCLVQRN